MRFFALIAVALAVVQSVFSLPVLKRSDATLTGKDKKSERTTVGIGGTVYQGGDGCLTGLIIYNSDTTTNCKFNRVQGQTQRANDTPWWATIFGTSQGQYPASNMVGKEAKKKTNDLV